MKTKNQIHQFDPVIYPFNLWIIVNNNLDFISREFKQDDGNEIVFTKDENKKAVAFTIPAIWNKTKEYGVVLFFRSQKVMSYKLVAHESTHAAKQLFKHIGADITPHEPFEYVVGWIAECCNIVRKFKESSARLQENDKKK